MTAAECRSNQWAAQAIATDTAERYMLAVTMGEWDRARELLLETGEAAETARLWAGLAESKPETAVEPVILKVAA